MPKDRKIEEEYLCAECDEYFIESFDAAPAPQYTECPFCQGEGEKTA